MHCTFLSLRLMVIERLLKIAELINVINTALVIFCCLLLALVLYTSNNGQVQHVHIYSHVGLFIAVFIYAVMLRKILNIKPFYTKSEKLCTI